MTKTLRRGQNKMTKKELKELPLIESEQVIALAFMGEAKFNATAAAALTGFSQSYCMKVVKKAHVMRFIDDELKAIGIQTRAARNATIQEALLVSQSDVVAILREVMDDDGHVDFASVKALPATLTKAIKTVKIVEEKKRRSDGSGTSYSLVRTEIQMHDKVPALALLDKMLRISENPEDKPKEKDQLQLVGIQIEAPDPHPGAIEAKFEVVDDREELPEWLR